MMAKEEVPEHEDGIIRCRICCHNVSQKPYRDAVDAAQADAAPGVVTPWIGQGSCAACDAGRTNAWNTEALTASQGEW